MARGGAVARTIDGTYYCKVTVIDPLKWCPYDNTCKYYVRLPYVIKLILLLRDAGPQQE